MRCPPDAVPRAVFFLVAALLLTGCGVRAQDRPEPVPTAAAPSSDDGGGSPAAGPRLTVFFIRGAELAPVERRTASTTTAAALDQLVEGPTRAEVRTGIRTALPPEVVGVDEVLPDGLATVSVTRGFTGISGGNQQLAVAQIVWTLTDLTTVSTVRFAVEGAPVEVPTDAGLTDRPVGRDDYRSVAPAETPSAPSTAPDPESSTPTGSSTPR